MRDSRRSLVALRLSSSDWHFIIKAHVTHQLCLSACQLSSHTAKHIHNRTHTHRRTHAHLCMHTHAQTHTHTHLVDIKLLLRISKSVGKRNAPESSRCAPTKYRGQKLPHCKLIIYLKVSHPLYLPLKGLQFAVLYHTVGLHLINMRWANPSIGGHGPNKKKFLL